MYTAGVLTLQWRQAEARPLPSDVRLDDDEGSGNIVFPVVYLPHRGEEWIIGGADQRRQLIADAQVLLAALEHSTEETRHE